MPQAFPFGTNPNTMSSMTPEEEMTTMLEMLEQLLEGIDQIPDANHTGPAGEWQRLDFQSTGSLRSPDWPQLNDSTGRPESLGLEFGIGAPAAVGRPRTVRRCAYLRTVASTSDRSRRC